MPSDNVEELRNALRTKRDSAFESDGQSSGRTDGTGFQTVLREGRSTVPTHRPTHLVSGRSDAKPGRLGQSDRRSSGGSSGSTDGTTDTSPADGRRRKRIKAEDTITRSYEEGLAPANPSVTIPKRPVGRPPKIVSTIADVEKKLTSTVKDTFSSSGKKVLTKQEASVLEEPLKAVIPDMSGYLDELLWWQLKDNTHAPIWSDLDADEIDVIVRLLLKQGQKSAVVAEGVRTMVDASDWIAAGMIVIPRTITSMKKLTAIAAEERRKKLEARYAVEPQRDFVSNQS